MTDNTQEPRDLIQICTDIYYECETINHLDELTDEALDWHNKQVVRELREVKRSVDAGWYATYRIAELEKESTDE